jgi:gamma-glutamyltranspeptidase/glutathione hydrolase
MCPNVGGMRGTVCSVDRLASEAGLLMLERGGNAVDAALATNAVLAVTAPHMCGMGGDLFALVHDGSVHALNASGRAGSGASADRLRAEGHTRMPLFHDIRSVPVPGCVDGWLALHSAYSRLSFDELFEPAIALAGEGFPASPLLAARLSDVPLEVREGVVRRKGVARTLRVIAAHGRDGFYRGEFGEGLLDLGNGEYDEEDLGHDNADWVEPLRIPAFGHHVWSMPPNSQGYLLLLSLGIADGLDLPDDPDDPLWAHLLVESSRAAGHDRAERLHERAVAPLDEVGRRLSMVDPHRRMFVRSLGAAGGTTYICTADGEGLGVSLSQSNALGFGSLLWEPRTGINLQNRGIGFSLDAGHPAEYAPGRRPPHTLVPALVTRPDGSLRTVVGTMGGDAQPQIVLQLITRLLRHGQSPEAVIAAPRWRLATDGHGFDTWEEPDAVRVEVEQGGGWAAGLSTRGHPVAVGPYGGTFGHAHLIDVQPDGSLVGAADPRALVGAALSLSRFVP